MCRKKSYIWRTGPKKFVYFCITVLLLGDDTLQIKLSLARTDIHPDFDSSRHPDH